MDLAEDSDAPLRRTHGGLRAGAKAFRVYLLNAQEAGVNHFALNLKVSNRPYREMLQELATEVYLSSNHAPAHRSSRLGFGVE